MDDFRVGSISPYDPYRDQQASGSPNRKKARRPKDQGSEQDEVVSSAEPAGDGDEQIEAGVEPEDYYSPSDRTEGPE